MAGDTLVPRPAFTCTHAVDIGVPRDAVWPWLVQIGQGRAGFYSHAWLENLIGCRLRNAERILPEHQLLEVGDAVPMHPRVEPFAVIEVRPPDILVLGWRPGGGRMLDGTTGASASWSFALSGSSRSATRLVVRMRMDHRSLAMRLVLRTLVHTGHGVMERAMLRGLRRRAEGSGNQPRSPT